MAPDGAGDGLRNAGRAPGLPRQAAGGGSAFCTAAF